MKPKKEIIVTFRTDAQTKALFDKAAEVNRRPDFERNSGKSGIFE